ncbi:diguanylate cyclase [Mesorhizobium microcysteis]|uniref:Diguanylate cyclase n=1 Tax=Neoaquamicrobium microcysteis TaxID=2682781 RepID=A0A5D4GP86_9HYPH|nr:sensor domain-containing diguanylate cyclase [Mesorhizobium microcysteis]TYR29954.1 diguanylate cyclase [Mesorhizobium microcysteis]
MEVLFTVLIAFVAGCASIGLVLLRQRRLAARIAMLEQQTTWYHDALRIAGAGIWQWNIEEDRWHWMEDIFQTPGSTLDYHIAMSEDFHRHLHPDDRDLYRSIEAACREGQESYLVEYRYRLDNGEIRWFRDIAHRVASAGEGAPTIFGITIDVTEEKQRTLDRERRSDQDDLTGLPNRRALMEHLADRLFDETEFALAFVDLNGFKTLNDQHGHASGDACLRLLGRTLSASLHDDEFAARMGGDEFVIIIPASDDETAIDRTSSLIGDALTVANRGIPKGRIGASAGLAFHPRHATTREGLLGAADSAMYRAKASGRSLALSVYGDDDATSQRSA